MVAFGTVQKKAFPLIETGEYIWTLNDVGEITGDYGDRMQWDFLVAPKESPTDYIARDDGKERVLRFFTDPEITLGSKQHEWIQALAGRQFGLDAELPDADDLLGKRMIGYLTHYTPKKGKNAGVPKEDIVAGSAKPFKIGGAKANGTAKAAAAAPAAATDERPELIAEMKKQIRRALLADVEAAESWSEINLDALETDELRSGIASVKELILAAQEA